MYKKILMFVDMDGVIVEYDYFPSSKKKNTISSFINQRPLLTTIELFKKVSKIKNIDMYILSSCRYNTQVNEKNIWLNKHAPFFKKENRIFIVHENENYKINEKKDMKAIYIENIIKKIDCDFIIMIDDSHELLKRAKKRIKKNIKVYHTSSLID